VQEPKMLLRCLTPLPIMGMAGLLSIKVWSGHESILSFFSTKGEKLGWGAYRIPFLEFYICTQTFISTLFLEI